MATLLYFVQVLLDVYRSQMMAAISQFKKPEYEQTLQEQIDAERGRQHALRTHAEQLEKQVRQLIDDSICLLRSRMAELGIEAVDNPVDLLNRAKDVVLRHKELQAKSDTLQEQVMETHRVLLSHSISILQDPC